MIVGMPNGAYKVLVYSFVHFLTQAAVYVTVNTIYI